MSLFFSRSTYSAYQYAYSNPPVVDGNRDIQMNGTTKVPLDTSSSYSSLSSLSKGYLKRSFEFMRSLDENEMNQENIAPDTKKRSRLNHYYNA